MKKIVIFLFFIAFQISYSQWYHTGFGFNNLNVNTATVNGNIIYEGTNLGVYASDDNGKSWKQLGLATETVYSLAADNNKIIAGTTNGVYLSTDNGKAGRRRIRV